MTDILMIPKIPFWMERRDWEFWISDPDPERCVMLKNVAAEVCDPVTPQPTVDQNAGERLKRFACLETVDWKSVIDRVEVVHKAEEPTK